MSQGTVFEDGASGAGAPAAVRGRAADASTSRLVIRDETIPAIETIKQSEKIAHNDWLGFTLTPPPEHIHFPIPWLLPQLISIFGLPVSQVQHKGRGWTGYKYKLEIGDNCKYGLIAYGGNKQRDTVHVELNATVCALVPDWQIVKQWGEAVGAKITRIDLAHDDFEGKAISIEQAKAWYEEGGFTNSGRPPKARLYDDLGSGEGKTLYIGNRANGKLARIYEKGKQLGDAPSPWVRVEVELRGKGRLIPWDVVTSPAKYLAGAYPCLAYLSTEQSKIRTISKAVQITLESIVCYLRIAGGKSINVLMQAMGNDAEAVIKAIRREGIPRRLANYEDFLEKVLEGEDAALVT